MSDGIPNSLKTSCELDPHPQVINFKNKKSCENVTLIYPYSKKSTHPLLTKTISKEITS